MMIGSAGAVLAARAIADRQTDDARVTFRTASAQVASTLQLAIQHEEDLIYAASAFIADNPEPTEADLAGWQTAVQAFRRYPELLGLGQVVVVPRAKLAAYAAATAPNGSFRVIPAGVRPFYCFTRVVFARPGLVASAPGFDVCAGNSTALSLASVDTGRPDYIPFGFGASTFLAVRTPVYRGGVTPSTVAGRRAAFLSWVGTEVVPKVVLARALAAHPNLAVRFTYASGASHADFRSGTVPPSARSSTTDLHNGWTVRTYGANPAVGVSASRTALVVLIGGILLSVVLAVLMFVLATGRRRALALVSAKTDELRHQALHDALTGLPNRALIMDRIEHLLARNLRSDIVGAVLYVDLDGFKKINDTLGHGVGDKLLEAAAARMTTGLREADTIGRMGGDEFVILLDDVSVTGAPETVAERLLDVFRQPFDLDGAAHPVLITASVGIALGHRDTPEQLLHEADVALYQAKAAGKNCYEVFRPEMDTEVQRHDELEFDLRSALEGGQFQLAYQPIYNLDDLSVVGAEALLRWDHPTRGRIQPDEFIPLLESSGQIIDVGRWVLHEACQQMAQWRARGSNLSVSVNVSARQLDRQVVVAHVREALEASGLDPSALTLEVTETALMRNVDATAARLRELKCLGVHVAVDDFGTGYSSLAYLQKFPVDCLKIDRSFTDSMFDSIEAESLVRALVQLGKALGLKTLAEGVETPAQMDYLRTQHVDEIQGFLLAHPLEAEALETKIFDPLRSSGSAQRP
ncbi:putative bifunctional diguanylate cyclase/phosphodiesterase [uncultured Jatrophihabitans sp.]|uniref:putative bifunctional diguanylate cyclase/phosphodiesterase n=1 Tax=uncultured Jatrophihabitans sp. TaxID=1610747 RepID=UPI0035CC2069